MILAVAGIGLYLGNALFNKSTPTAFAATSVVTADTLKNQILETIYKAVMNPSVLLQNIEAVKSEVNNYTTQLTNLATEHIAGRIPASTITFYVRKIAEEIAQKLSLELKPAGYGGGYGGYDGGTGYGDWYDDYWPPGGGKKKKKWNQWTKKWEDVYDDYSDLYSQYLRYYMMMQMMQGGGGGYGGTPYGYGGNYYQQYYPSQQQPNYGYSQGYGYQSPNMQPYYPTQNYQYYPTNTPYYGGAGGYPNYGGYY